MNHATLYRAIAEAERFVKAAKAADRRRLADFKNDQVRLGLTDPDRYHNTSKENAACKRASLDLTYTLADLRQGQ